MRQIKIGNKTFEVRGLSRGEVRQVRQAGFNLNVLTLENAEDALDFVFDIVFSKEDNLILDDLPNSFSMKVWRAVLFETYGSEEEEKNLPPSGAGTQTQKE